MKTLKICLFLAALVVFSQCKKSDTDPTTVKDIDGNTYNIVQIGDQFWLKENLMVTKYRDGHPIPNNADSTVWANLTLGGRCYYDNDADNNGTYGSLYNWFAVDNERGLCPTGWHVPTDAEWTELVEYLGGEYIAGGKMKTTTLWEAPNEGATNNSGFSALPAGERTFESEFKELGFMGTWWSQTQDSEEVGISYHIENSFANIGRNYNNKKAGFSVRCIKD
jgi:uncharacterized protein (TIGR02145 family)